MLGGVIVRLNQLLMLLKLLILVLGQEKQLSQLDKLLRLSQQQ